MRSIARGGAGRGTPLLPSSAQRSALALPPTAPCPPAVSILEAPPGGFLEERLEQQWAGAADPTLGYDAPSGFGSGGAVDGPSLYRWGQGCTGGRGRAACEEAVFAAAAQGTPALVRRRPAALRSSHAVVSILDFNTAAIDGFARRQEMRLSIGGLEVRPSVWRRAFEDGGGSEGEPGEDRAAAMALGYVAQVCLRGGLQAGGSTCDEVVVFGG